MMTRRPYDTRPAARGGLHSPTLARRVSLRGALLAVLCLAPYANLRAAFTADLSEGEVSLRLEASPETVRPEEDLLLTVTVEAPAYLTVTVPNLLDRFSGFATAEDFAAEPLEAGGRRRQVIRWRLEPKPGAERYRLAPFAVETLDTRAAPPRRAAFATRPVVFPAAPLRAPASGAPEVTPKPEWIPPTVRTVLSWIALALAALAALAGTLFGLTRLSRHVRESRLSPVERAWTELQRLLGRRLPERGLFKDFYIELTFVVRRYIERTHGIRAPEQTTQEFLTAASRHPHFDASALAQLRTFLESADLVKFAGQTATVALTDAATQKARDYIEADARLCVQPQQTPTPTS